MTDELGQPQLPWMATSFGMVFMGMHKATDADYDALKEYLGVDELNRGVVDPFSEVGRLNPFWTAKIYIAGDTSSDKLGGLGSHTYETQYLTDNYGAGDVEFMDIDRGEIWHINPAGERVFGELYYPRTLSAYHKDEWGQAAAGPKPGTTAAEWLGEDGTYDWDDDVRAWKIVK